MRDTSWRAPLRRLAFSTLVFLPLTHLASPATPSSSWPSPRLRARTLAVYQVRLFFPGAPENKIGPAVGSLGSAFNFAQLATSFQYGWISDVTGRPKLLIMLANVACGLGATFFALATSYPGAMISRVVAGAFMTSGVVMKGERVVVVSLGANTGVGKLFCARC